MVVGNFGDDYRLLWRRRSNSHFRTRPGGHNCPSFCGADNCPGCPGADNCPGCPGGHRRSGGAAANTNDPRASREASF